MVSQSTIDALKKLEESVDAPIPEWAVRKSHGLLEIGAQLPTRDGRRMGNAHIIDSAPFPRGRTGILYTVLTDAGARIKLTAREIDELFYPPQWVADIGEVVEKFSRE